MPEWLCVCSDETTGNLDQDEFLSGAYDLGIPTTTDPKEIAAFLRRRGKGHGIIFTTYHSSPVSPRPPSWPSTLSILLYLMRPTKQLA